MLLNELKTKSIRFFVTQSNDMWMILMKEFYFWYLLNLLIDKLDFKLNNINLEIVYPTNNYINNLFKNCKYFKEEYFVFYLENSYHSNNYSLNFLKVFLDKAELSNKKIIIYSKKINDEKSEILLKNYENIILIIKSEIEYFFYQFFYNKLDINNIWNLIYRQTNWSLIYTKKEDVNYDLKDYILWWHYSWYLDKFQKSKDYIMNMIDDDNDRTSNLLTYNYPKNIKISHFRNQTDDFAMISSGRWCKYKCNYCYRWAKFSKIRNIPITIIKKDLDYLNNNFYKNIYFYDDCFLTTNYDRIDAILWLMSKYQFKYWISIRYEICSDEIFEKLLKINFYRIQIWLQSTSFIGNKASWRNVNIEKFKLLILKFNEKNIHTSIDIILWLPWDSLNDFIETLNFAISLNPWNIHINTLFINQWTKLYDEIDKHWIITNNPDNYLFSAPNILESKTFSKKDIILAKKYVEKIKEKIKSINIILR